MDQDLDGKIRAALHEVRDPCSVAANAPLSIIDMGLVRGWSVDEQANVLVEMCLTSPSCTMSPFMVRAAEAALLAVPGVTSARVHLAADFFWTPAEMTEKGRALLEGRRQGSMAATEVTPQQWRRDRNGACR